MSPVESDGSDAEGGKRGSDDSDDADDDEDPRARLVMSLSERIAEMDEVGVTREGRARQGWTTVVPAYFLTFTSLPLSNFLQELMTTHARIAELEGGGGAEEDLNG